MFGEKTNNDETQAFYACTPRTLPGTPLCPNIPTAHDLHDRDTRREGKRAFFRCRSRPCRRYELKSLPEWTDGPGIPKVWIATNYDFYPTTTKTAPAPAGIGMVISVPLLECQAIPKDTEIDASYITRSLTGCIFRCRRSGYRCG